MNYPTYIDNERVADWSAFEAHLVRQRRFSMRAFGPGKRTEGVLQHIQKECDEVREADDLDQSTLPEWIDLVILALDGALRTGVDPAEIITALLNKQDENEKRPWPDWRLFDQTTPIEHIRGTTPHES